MKKEKPVGEKEVPVIGDSTIGQKPDQTELDRRADVDRRAKIFREGVSKLEIETGIKLVIETKFKLVPKDQADKFEEQAV